MGDAAQPPTQFEILIDPPESPDADGTIIRRVRMQSVPKSDYSLVMDVEYKRLTDTLGSGRSMFHVKLPTFFIAKVRDIMKPDTVQVGRSTMGNGWVFVEPSEGCGEAFWGNEESVKHKVVVRNEEKGWFRERRVEVRLLGGGNAGKWWLDVRDKLCQPGNCGRSLPLNP
jgi:hypothetical protein